MINPRLKDPVRVRIERSHDSRAARILVDGNDVSNIITSVTWSMEAGRLPTATVTFLDVDVDIAAEIAERADSLGISGMDWARLRDFSPVLAGLLERLKERADEPDTAPDPEASMGTLLDAYDFGPNGMIPQDLRKAMVEETLREVLAPPVVARARVVPKGEPLVSRPLPGDDKRTPEQWCDHYGVEILDPDGWRSKTAPAWDEPITLPEFWKRAIGSTVRNAVDPVWDRIGRDARLAAAEAKPDRD